MIEITPRKPISEGSRLGTINKQGIFKLLNGNRSTLAARFHVKSMNGFAEDHVCIGARSLAKTGLGFYMAVYTDMQTVETALNFIEDLELYYEHSSDIDGPIKTFAAIFSEHVVADGKQFVADYWSFAQTLHNIDCLANAYDPKVSSNPQSKSFELSLAGRAVFTTTLNPASPRTARKSSFPIWIMNQLSQFDELRETGKFENWKKTIRRLDAEVDPSSEVNPVLADHGLSSARDQLAGAAPTQFTFQTWNTKKEKRAALAELISKATSEDAGYDVVERLKERARKGNII